MLTDVTKTGQSRESRGLQADIMLPTYHGNVQPMATRSKVCPVGSAAYISRYKLFSKSTGTMLTDVTKTGQSRKIRGLYHVANLSLQCAAHGHTQQGLPCRVYSVEQQFKALSKLILTDVTKTGQSREIRGSASRYHFANLSQQYAAHGHTQGGLSCRVDSVHQQF